MNTQSLQKIYAVGMHDQQKLSYFKCGGKNSEEFLQQFHILRLCSFWTLELLSKLCSFEALIISSRFICFKNLPALYSLNATKPTYICHVIIAVLKAHSDKNLCYSHIMRFLALSSHQYSIFVSNHPFKYSYLVKPHFKQEFQLMQYIVLIRGQYRR